MSGPSFVSRKEQEQVDAVIGAIRDIFGFGPEILLSKTRDRGVSRARQIAFYILRKQYGLTYPAIAVAFGRDHTTVIHGVGVVDAQGGSRDLDSIVEATQNKLSPVNSAPVDNEMQKSKKPSK